MNLGAGKIVKKPYIRFSDKVLVRMRITVKSGGLRFEKSKPFVQKLEKELKEWA